MNPIVVKVGGSTLGSHDTAIEDIAALHRGGRKVIVVHGGGDAATRWLKLHGVASEFVDGLRVTGPDAIDVVAAVFAGLVNKRLVAQLVASGVKAVGLSGVDGGMISTTRLDERLGFVGEVKSVDPSLLEDLLSAGYLPVVAPLALWGEQPGQLMNVNADTIAGELAAAVRAERLVFLTDVPGVKDESGEWARTLVPETAQRMIDRGIAAGGMVPKLRACIQAARSGVRSHVLDGREPHALRAALDGASGGTSITLL